MNKKRILVFASGRGSNAEALHEAMEKGDIKGDLVGVICDHGEARVLARAEKWQVPTVVIERKACRDIAEYHKKILSAAVSFRPDLICLAGYMRLCDESLVKAFPHRIMNIHPALLPSFRGLHAQRQAVEAGVKVSGCTVHFVDVGLDDGPIITQVAVPVYDDDTEETLSERILEKEHRAYVAAVTAFCEDRLHVEGHRVIGMHKGEEV